MLQREVMYHVLVLYGNIQDSRSAGLALPQGEDCRATENIDKVDGRQILRMS